MLLLGRLFSKRMAGASLAKSRQQLARLVPRNRLSAPARCQVGQVSDFDEEKNGFRKHYHWCDLSLSLSCYNKGYGALLQQRIWGTHEAIDLYRWPKYSNKNMIINLIIETTLILLKTLIFILFLFCIFLQISYQF